MFEIIKSYFNKKEYYLIITEDEIFIKNYTKIIDITQEKILININNIKFNIKGNNLTLKKIINKDLLVKGKIESVTKYDNN